MTPAISISHLSKTYASGFQALKDVNLDIRRGEIFALLGPNGAGKTTLINIVCGIVKPSAGSVKVDGHDILIDYRAARAQIASAEANYSNARAAVEADVRSAARNAQAAAEKLELAKQSATLARESARIAQLQYKNGVISFNDANQIEQTAISAEDDLIAARVNYVVAVVALRLSLGPSDPAAATDLRNG